MLQAYEFALEKVGVDFNSYQASSNYNILRYRICGNHHQLEVCHILVAHRYKEGPVCEFQTVFL